MAPEGKHIHVSSPKLHALGKTEISEFPCVFSRNSGYPKSVWSWARNESISRTGALGRVVEQLHMTGQKLHMFRKPEISAMCPKSPKFSREPAIQNLAGEHFSPTRRQRRGKADQEGPRWLIIEQTLVESAPKLVKISQNWPSSPELGLKCRNRARFGRTRPKSATINGNCLKSLPN